MSINDLLDSDLTPVLLIMFIVIIIAIPIGLAMGKKTNNNIYGDDEYGAIREVQNVKIVGKRSAPHPLSPTVMVNTVVFEASNGSRVELAIKDPNTYGIMVEGDRGTLRYQGKKFVSFERGSNNEA